MGSKLTSNRSISENACVDSCVKISNEDAEIFWHMEFQLMVETQSNARFVMKSEPTGFTNFLVTW